MSSPKPDIIALATRAGFDSIRVASPYRMEREGHFFKDFLALGRHGDMAWMNEKVDRRTDPLTLWPDVKSIIMLGMNYGPDHDPLEILNHKEYGSISVYARGKDYHDIVKKRLKQVAREMVRKFDADVKVFVDTAPVMEKPLAARSGLGWQGKHTNLVNREFGSWLFIGSIFTTLELEADDASTDHCGSCQSCLDICPTNAFPAPRQLDARRCISYLTIEYKGHIDEEFRRPMKNRIYGCDDCLAVCPWNKYARQVKEAAYFPRVELTYPELGELATLDDASFRQVFSGSPIKRIGRDFFIRNVLIAVGNSGQRHYIPLLTGKLAEPSEYVRAMAVWALKEIVSDDEFSQYKTLYSQSESDENVLREWQERSEIL